MIRGAIEQIVSAFGTVLSSLGSRRDSGPIDTVDAMQAFVSTRSAFVAQKKLYGYLKERIGTRWPKMFEDEIFVESINIASMQVFAACLSDMTIFAVANALHGEQHDVTDQQRDRLAMDIYRAGLAANPAHGRVNFNTDKVMADFKARLGNTDWAFGARQPENFTRSPAALVKWAPIAQELKSFDEEIVENSVKFAWVDVREQFLKRLVAEAIADQVARQYQRTGK